MRTEMEFPFAQSLCRRQERARRAMPDHHNRSESRVVVSTYTYCIVLWDSHSYFWSCLCGFGLSYMFEISLKLILSAQAHYDCDIPCQFYSKLTPLSMVVYTWSEFCLFSFYAVFANQRQLSGYVISLRDIPRYSSFDWRPYNWSKGQVSLESDV
jgi:hypothetical protein